MGLPSIAVRLGRIGIGAGKWLHGLVTGGGLSSAITGAAIWEYIDSDDNKPAIVGAVYGFGICIVGLLVYLVARGWKSVKRG
jgi:hypothetical protein